MGALTMPAGHIPFDVIAILGAALLSVALFRRFRLPAIVAYVAAGIAIGPHVLAVVTPGPTMRLLGDIGVAFLLFTIGLEFSLAELRGMRDTLLKLGGGQVIVGTLSGAAIAWAWGAPWHAALVIGGALSMSSTAIVMKQLADQRELLSRHGRLSAGVLLFQDLAAIPFIVAIPILARADGQVLASLSLALLAGVFALIAALAAGRWLLRPLFHEVAESKYPDLFTITVLLVSLTAAWGTAAAGLSLALGAFLAGMMLGETEYRHQIENDIRPMRDMLVGLFFMTVGMDLDLANLWPAFTVIVLLVAGLVLGKGGVVYLLARLLGTAHEDALRAGLTLGNGGEFSIALLSLAMASGLVPVAQGQAIITAVIVTMLLAPVLIGRGEKWVRRLSPALRPPQPPEAMPEIVLLCGYGRTGRLIGRVLDEIGVAYVALDRDPGCVKDAWEAGAPVYFGDAANSAILKAAGLARARAVVLSFASFGGERGVVEAIRRERPELPILVRASDDAQLDALIRAGASEGVPETMEAALMLIFQLLVLLEIPAGEALEHIRMIRGDRYPLLRGFIETLRPIGGATDARRDEHLKTIILPPHSSAIGRCLGEMNLADKGVLLAGFRRPRSGALRPAPDLAFQAGDVLVLHGNSEDLRRVEQELVGES
jgi:CPA2 family monovalent cation:H+ antiporter-2